MQAGCTFLKRDISNNRPKRSLDNSPLSKKQHEKNNKRLLEILDNNTLSGGARGNKARALAYHVSQVPRTNHVVLGRPNSKSQTNAKYSKIQIPKCCHFAAFTWASTPGSATP